MPNPKNMKNIFVYSLHNFSPFLIKFVFELENFSFRNHRIKIKE